MENTKIMSQLDLLGGWYVLTADDLRDLSEATRRVFNLLRDKKWHSATEICLVAGRGDCPASEGLRRARELRQKGFILEKKRLGDGRTWLYRLKM